MKIIVDAMGGDNAPLEIVKGSLKAHKELKVDIVLVGRQDEVTEALKKAGFNTLPEGIEIVHASDVIEMEDDPVTAVRVKKNSSLVVGLRLLRDGGGDALVSAGSTGAILSGATLITKRIRGIRRAALAPIIPGNGGDRMIIDCGANAECSPEYLLQFAYMGSFYMEDLMKRKNPRIGLLNIGTEKSKGSQLQLDTYGLLQKAHDDGVLNFVGNIEARDVFEDVFDVLVCDGFSGNVLLKAIEGTSQFFSNELKSVFGRNLLSKLGALCTLSGIRELKTKMDPDRVGGTALLGISKPVIKAHGSSNEEAFFNAVRHAYLNVETRVTENIKENIDRIKIEGGEE